MKYMGSKNRLAKELAPIIQSYITEETKGYLEPFVGGANMIDKIVCNKRYGSDLHKELIALLSHISISFEDVPNTITKQEYDNVKNNIKNFEDWYVGLVGFCASYNGKYFGGYANDVYTKKNTIRMYTDEAIRNLKKQTPNLKGIIFKHCSFLDIKPTISNFVIYCDPPYRDTTKYKIEEFPYEQFYDWCRKMSKNNIVIVSEYNMPNDFKCIWSKEITTSMYKNRIVNDDKNNRVEKLFICK